jgi:hypothetical protein
MGSPNKKTSQKKPPQAQLHSTLKRWLRGHRFVGASALMRTLVSSALSASPMNHSRRRASLAARGFRQAVCKPWSQATTIGPQPIRKVDGGSSSLEVRPASRAARFGKK